MLMSDDYPMLMSDDYPMLMSDDYPMLMSDDDDSDDDNDMSDDDNDSGDIQRVNGMKDFKLTYVHATLPLSLGTRLVSLEPGDELKRG